MAESGLRDHVGYWLRRLSDEVHTAFDRRLAEHDVSVAQWNLLVSVYHGNADTTAQAARYIDIDPAAVSRLADRLVEKGLLRREPDPGSRRRTLLVLTEHGRELVPRLIRHADANDAEFFGGLEAVQRAQLVSMLRSLLPSTGAEGDDRSADERR